MSFRDRQRRGMTLLEVAVSVAILGIIAGVVLPVVGGAGEAYAQAARARRIAERTGYALERVQRLLRDAPGGSDLGTLDIALASAGAVRFGDGRGLELSGTDLMLRAADGTTSRLCQGVTAFELGYLDMDGVTSRLATSAQTHQFTIRLQVEEFELRTTAFPRVRLIGP